MRYYILNDLSTIVQFKKVLPDDGLKVIHQKYQMDIHRKRVSLILGFQSSKEMQKP